MILRTPSLVLLITAAACANAAWRFGGDLHPAGSTNSVNQAGFGVRQGGYAIFSSVQEAVIWSGTAASAVRLHPAGATLSEVRAMNATHQVGRVVSRAQERAAIWRGTRASYVSLHPTQFTTVVGTVINAIATNGAYQVGSATLSNGSNRACYWRGTAASFRFLPPPIPGATYNATGVDGNIITGTVNSTTGARAGYWLFPTLKWVWLHPSTANSSLVYGVTGNFQVGNVMVNGLTRAALWRSQNTGVTSLHPAGASISGANDILAGWVAGFATVNNVQCAYAFPGRANGAVNLQRLLPRTYTSSFASSIHSNGNLLVIGGLARVGTTARAVYWVGP